jgi:hypothetical protein
MKLILCVISVSSLLAVTATVTGCRSSHSDSYSRGYEAGHYGAGAPSQGVTVQSGTVQSGASTNYLWLGSAPAGSELQPQPGTTYIWQGYAKPVAGGAQGAAPTEYYSSQGQGQAPIQSQQEKQGFVSRKVGTELNTTIMPYSAFRGTDEHWYNTPGWVEPESR